jgi:hypothetical protein
MRRCVKNQQVIPQNPTTGWYLTKQGNFNVLKQIFLFYPYHMTYFYLWVTIFLFQLDANGSGKRRKLL